MNKIKLEKLLKGGDTYFKIISVFEKLLRPSRKKNGFRKNSGVFMKIDFF